VGIGVNFIGRKIGEELKKFVQLIFEAWKDDNRNALLYTPAGDNSVPVNDERLILAKVDGDGKYIALGVLTLSQNAQPGEKILFGRDQKGNITVKISMFNSGDFKLDTDTETTGEATGNFDKIIKGLTTVLERKDRTYTNEANVTETIKKDRSVTIEGNATKTVKKDQGVTIKGNETRDITKNKTETIGGDLTAGIDGDRNTELGGNDTENISGDANWSISGNLNLTVGGNVTINGAKISLN
jgi:hypothetical protein